MQRLGKYEILDRLGAGGMAVVYRARDSSLDRYVALKVINQRLEEEGEAILKRFLHEAKIAAGLTHPNIVVIYELGVEEGLPYIAMEYLTGCDLQELIRGKARFTLEQKVDIVLQIARALEHAHSRGVIHRDIKPGNIRVLENGQAKLVDFGIAKATSANLTRLTQPGTVLGTVAYMSPEQLMGEPPDPASDVFSFGVVFYELLTGRKPFESGDLASLVFRIVHGDPNPFTPDDALLPDGLRGIVLRCLAKPASARYPGFTAIIQDLVSFQRGGQDSPQTQLAPGMFDAARQQAQASAKAPHEQTSATEAYTAEVSTGERVTQPVSPVSADTSASPPVVRTVPETSEPTKSREAEAAAQEAQAEPQEPEAEEPEPEEPEAEEFPPQSRSRLPLVAGGLLGLAGVVAAALFWPGPPPDGGDLQPTPRPTASLSTPAAPPTEAPLAASATEVPTPSQDVVVPDPLPAEVPSLQESVEVPDPLQPVEVPPTPPATEAPAVPLPPTMAPSLPPSTPSPSPPPSPTPSPSSTRTLTATPSSSSTQTPSLTPSATPSSSPTPSPTLSPTSTHTPVPTPTADMRALAGQNKKVEDARNRALQSMKAADDAKARSRVPPARDRAGAAFSSAEKALAEGKQDQAASQFALAGELYRQAADLAAKVATAEQMAASSDYSPALGLLEAVFDAYPTPGPSTVALRKRLLELREAVEGPLAKAEDSLVNGDVKAAWEALATLTPEQRKLPQVEEMLSRIDQRIRTDSQAPDLQLASPSFTTAQPFVLEVGVTDASGVASVIFHSRCQDEDFFEARPMEPAGQGRYRASIGAERHKNKPVRYYVEAVDVAGNRGSSGTAKKPLQASPKKP